MNLRSRTTGRSNKDADMITRRRFIQESARGTALMAGLALAGARHAGAAQSPDEVAAIAQAESYLNGIESMQARFVQISSNGAYAEGSLFIRRPGRLRFEYDPPVPILLIADGVNLLYYDKELKQSTFIPLWETPLWFLIRKKVDLREKIRATDVQRAGGALRMTLEEKGKSEVGAVTLVFSDRPFALRKWEVTDAQGIMTQVTLQNPEFGTALDDAVFDTNALDPYGFRGDRQQP